MSSLREALTKYITVRRALGTQLREPAVTLGYFLNYLEQQRAKFITTDLALRWAMQPKGVLRSTWARRLSMVRRFADWLHATDPRHEVPPGRLLDARRRRNKPHIFTDQEIKRLIGGAVKLPSLTGLRPRTYVTLIGLLASTGLRPNEALALDISDVDLDNGILFIRESKFGKSRFVPISDSTRVALLAYSKKRDKLYPDRETSAFLVSGRGRRLVGCVARKTFAQLSCAIGLRPAAQPRCFGRGPRLQDFRHRFATRRLMEWYRSGLDVEREMPKLATYLGHVDVAHTYWYIDALPELLQLATERLRRRRPGGKP